MLRRFCAFLILAVALLGTSEALAGRQQPLRVLFIGNSYTEVNDLPKMLADLARAGGQKSIQYERETPGGWTFRKHWDGGKAVKKIESRKWDFVVLQEFSLGTLVHPKETRVFGGQLHAAAAKNGARTLFYMTWARQNLPAQQPVITKVYREMAAELNAQVAPVGVAWAMSLQKNPKVALHTADMSHPTPAGTYLAACVFYATLFQKSPEGLPSGTAKLDPATTRQLQAIAWQVVQFERMAQKRN